jgi:hypothetical protein
MNEYQAGTIVSEAAANKFYLKEGDKIKEITSRMQKE